MSKYEWPNAAVQYSAGFLTVLLFMIQLKVKLQLALLDSVGLAKLVHCNIMLRNCTNSACLTAADHGVSANILGIGAEADSTILTCTDLVHILHALSCCTLYSVRLFSTLYSKLHVCLADF